MFSLGVLVSVFRDDEGEYGFEARGCGGFQGSVGLVLGRKGPRKGRWGRENGGLDLDLSF